MEDKLKKKIAVSIENAKHEYTEFATDKLYSLTADVARKYGRYLLEGNIGSFDYSITHIYQPR